MVSKDSIHILKHHGSYMQQNRDLKKKSERDQSYQFMLRLKVINLRNIHPYIHRSRSI